MASGRARIVESTQKGMCIDKEKLHVLLVSIYLQIPESFDDVVSNCPGRSHSTRFDNVEDAKVLLIS